jgi:hypothetical protein
MQYFKPVHLQQGNGIEQRITSTTNQNNIKKQFVFQLPSGVAVKYRHNGVRILHF